MSIAADESAVGGAIGVCVLGPLQVHGPTGPLVLREGLTRKLVVSLALRRGAPVPVDVLIEELWPVDQPTNARNALQAQVSYVRRMLEPLAPEINLARAADAYVLSLANASSLDVVRFERAVHAATSMLTQEGSPTDALAELDGALTLWRGIPYTDVMYDDFVQHEIARLKEVHATAREQRAAALLELGRAGDALELLQVLVEEHPLRESLWAALILAMYRSRRQADALRVFGTARQRLIEELGVEPCVELRELEARVLAQDPTLDWVAPTAIDGNRSISGSGAGVAGQMSVGTAALFAKPNSRVPVPVSSLIGRAFEIDHVYELLSTHRLITLVGPGGIGKSRLAVEVAHRCAETMHTVMIELGALSPDSDVTMLIAAELGVPTQPGVDPLGAVASQLGDLPSLLIFDTCEHVLNRVALTASKLLRLKPELRVLATSRQPLGVSGELVWSVPPLELPDADVTSRLDAAASGAVRLFVERASAARPGFVLDDSNAASIARICRALDGLPLAIELAAARSTLLSPARIEERLSDRFALLSHGGRDAEARQQSLRSTIEWSYELLDHDDQVFFDRLSVMSGPFDLDAAVAICGLGLSGDPLESLSSLVDRSLVRSLEGDRFAMLDTLRSFAAEQLDRSDPAEAADTRDRHARWYLDVALAADPWSHGPLPGHWSTLRADALSCVAALEWLRSCGQAEKAARLAGALAGFWVLEGQLARADHWLKALRGVEVDDVTAASVLRGIAVVELYQSRFEESCRAGRESVARARCTGDPVLIASSSLPLGSALWGEGDFAGSIEVLREAAQRFEEASDRRGHGFALARLGRTLTSMDDPDDVNCIERSIELLAQSGDGWMMCVAQEHLAGALMRRGLLAAALDAAQRAVAVGRDAGSHSGQLFALARLARVHVASGDLDRALETIVLALRRAIDYGNPGAIADGLDAGAAVMHVRGEHAIAAELLGVSNAVRDQRRAAVAAVSGDVRVALVAQLAGLIGERAYADLDQSGRARGVDWAFDVLSAAEAKAGEREDGAADALAR